MGAGMSVAYELSVSNSGYPHLTVWDRLQDGRPAGFRVNADEGFVFYDPAEIPETQIDPMTGEMIPGEVYYARVRYLPRNYDWSKFGLRTVECGENGKPTDLV